jgi:hypothetical protein
MDVNARKNKMTNSQIDKMVAKLDEKISQTKRMDLNISENLVQMIILQYIREILLSGKYPDIIKSTEYKYEELEKRVAVIEAMNEPCKCEKNVHDRYFGKKDAPAVEWKCPHCGKDEGTWFDRTLDENMNMTTRCNACGGDIDYMPEAKPECECTTIMNHSDYECRCKCHKHPKPKPECKYCHDTGIEYGHSCRCMKETAPILADNKMGKGEQAIMQEEILAIIQKPITPANRYFADQIAGIVRSHTELPKDKILVDRKVAEEWKEWMRRNSVIRIGDTPLFNEINKQLEDK